MLPILCVELIPSTVHIYTLFRLIWTIKPLKDLTAERHFRRFNLAMPGRNLTAERRLSQASPEINFTQTQTDDSPVHERICVGPDDKW